MNANSKRPDTPDNDDAGQSSDDFESGLDYGAFAEDDPDFPEERIGSEDEETTVVPKPQEAVPGDSSRQDSPARDSGSHEPDQGEQATTAVPAPDQDKTRPLSDEANQARGAAGDDRSQASPADRSKASSTDDEATPAPVGMAAAGTSTSPASTRSPATSPADVAAEERDIERTADLSAVRDPARSTTEGKAQHVEAQQAGTRTVEAEPAPVAASPSEPTRPYQEAVPAGAARRGSTEVITDADLDDEVARDKRGASRVLQVLIAIFVPVLVIAAAIRLVASPVFLWIAYNRPGFPADGAGFDVEDRLVYGSYGMDYLFNAANSRYLAELAPGGEQLFTDAEVSHMTDVKWVILITMATALVLLVLTLIFALMLRGWRPGGVARGFFAGAWVTLGLVIAVAVLAVLSWQQFFDTFHRILFEEGTWTFGADSALIRLYPEQFWIDSGIAVAGLVIVIAVLALIITWPTRRRRARRQARLEEVHSIRREQLVTELTKDAEYSNAPGKRR